MACGRAHSGDISAVRRPAWPIQVIRSGNGCLPVRVEIENSQFAVSGITNHSVSVGRPGELVIRFLLLLEPSLPRGASVCRDDVKSLMCSRGIDRKGDLFAVW